MAEPRFETDEGDPWSGLGPAERRFHLINVSLGKSGTTSVAGLFRRYRAAHEFMYPEAAAAIHAHVHGRLDEAGFRRFALQRMLAGGLEVDSASFNHWYARHLVRASSRARFLLVVREPGAWLDSALAQLWREHRAAAGAGGTLPPWIAQMAEVIAGRFDPAMLQRMDLLQPALPGLVRALLGYWNAAHRGLLGEVPHERRLVLALPALSAALPRIADFAGVAAATLDASAVHLHRRGNEPRLLDAVDRDWLAETVERQCGDTWRSLRALLGDGEAAVSAPVKGPAAEGGSDDSRPRDTP